MDFNMKCLLAILSIASIQLCDELIYLILFMLSEDMFYTCSSLQSISFGRNDIFHFDPLQRGYRGIGYGRILVRKYFRKPYGWRLKIDYHGPGTMIGITANENGENWESIFLYIAENACIEKSNSRTRTLEKKKWNGFYGNPIDYVDMFVDLERKIVGFMVNQNPQYTIRTEISGNKLWRLSVRTRYHGSMVTILDSRYL
jgi:hypothetical protein